MEPAFYVRIIVSEQLLAAFFLESLAMKIIQSGNKNNIIFQKIYTCANCTTQFKIEPGDQPLEINEETFWWGIPSKKYARFACPGCFETWDLLLE